MQLLKSAPIAAEMRADHLTRVENLGFAPSLDVILAVGLSSVDGASELYVQRKLAYAHSVGVDARAHRLIQPVIPRVLQRLIASNPPDGLMIQMPLPEKCQVEALTRLIPLKMDADGLHPDTTTVSPTALAMDHIATYNGVNYAGNTAIIGALSHVAGGPLAADLKKRGYNPWLIDLKLGNTGEMREAIAQADTVLLSCGVPGLVTLDMLPTDREITLIDAGVKVIDGVPYGDLHPDIFASDNPGIRATPPTGAVGPLTIRHLIDNVIQFAENPAFELAAAQQYAA